MSFCDRFLLLGLLLSSPLYGEGAESSQTPEKNETILNSAKQDESKLPPRKLNWSVGFDARDLNVTPGNRRFKQREVSPDINIGITWIEPNWWAMGRVHLPLGPNSQRYAESPPLDTEGYGLSFNFGKSLLNHQLRQTQGDYGVEVGIESFELTARSFRKQSLNDGGYTDFWVVKTRWMAITPSIFATFLKPARPEGNKPEWLMTRIEGYRVALGVVIPVQRSWDLRYEKNTVLVGDRGSWSGVHGLLSWNAWLGI